MTLQKNKNLHNAKVSKNDEFYTQLTDIEKELKHYKHHFKDKVVLCNCDDPEWSEFWNYFKLNFDELGLKKLIATHYIGNRVSEYERSYKLELFGYEQEPIKTELEGDGDFASDECIALLDGADIVVTNPPFSLFRQYINLLMNHNKKFVIIGNKNAITYKEFFPYLKNNEIWIGHNVVKEFLQPDGSIKKFGNIGWFTNLDISKRHEDLILWRRYYDDNGNPTVDALQRYQKYDNYEAINVDKVADIPIDYEGVMGVPITFLDKYNPSQVEIIDANTVKHEGTPFKAHGLIKDADATITNEGGGVRTTYARILIRKRN